MIFKEQFQLIIPLNYFFINSCYQRLSVSKIKEPYLL